MAQPIAAVLAQPTEAVPAQPPAPANETAPAPVKPFNPLLVEFHPNGRNFDSEYLVSLYDALMSSVGQKGSIKNCRFNM